MGPILFLIGAGLVALTGCSNAPKPKFTRTPPPPPPDPDCSGSSYGLKTGAAGLFPCASQSQGASAYFSAAPSGAEWPQPHRHYLDSVLEDMRFHGTDAEAAMALAKNISPAGETLTFRPSQKSRLLGLAGGLLEAKNSPAGFFQKEYGERFAEVESLVRSGKLKVRFSLPAGALEASYDPQSDTLHLSDVLPASLNPETKSRWLGALFDFAQDAAGRPVESIAHAFERATLQGLYLLEAAGLDIAKLSAEELAQWQKSALRGNPEAPYLASALNAYFYRSRDLPKRFEQLRIFAEAHEHQRLRQEFRRSYDKAAKNSPFHDSWDRITDENYRPAPPPMTKVQEDIRKLEKLRQSQLEALRREVKRSTDLQAAEDKKSDLIIRSRSPEELRVKAEVQKSLQALTETWATLSFLRDVKRNAEYSLKEMSGLMRPEEEFSQALADYGILGGQELEFDGLR